MLKPYNELTEAQKETAREEFPENYAELWYQFRGVIIAFAAK